MDKLRNNLPFDKRNMENAGRYRGVGLKSKVGDKKSGFSDQPATKSKRVGKPPLKFN